MTRGVRLYLVGSFVLVSLAGCGRGFFQSAEREPWRAEAEVACLKSGAVKETAELVRISPISGPGVCGAEYPLKVAALGENIAASVLPTKACGRPGVSATSRAGRLRARRPQRRPKETIKETIEETIREIIREIIRIRRRASRTMRRHPTGRFRSPPRVSIRRRMTSICRSRACRNRATRAAADIGQHRPIPRVTVTRRLRQRLIRSRPIRNRRQRRLPCRGSGPRREIPSARSGRSR